MGEQIISSPSSPRENVKPLFHSFGADEEISRRHRNFFGYNMPLVNFDFIGMHYDHAVITDLCEFKHSNIQTIDLRQANYRAVQDAADKLGVPFFVIVYHPSDWSYFMLQYNLSPTVKRHVAHPTVISERNLVEGLYKIRGRRCPPELASGLSDTMMSKNLVPQIVGLDTERSAPKHS